MKHIGFFTFFFVFYSKVNGFLCECIPEKDGECNLTTVDIICRYDVNEAPYDSDTEERTLNVTGEHALNFTYPLDNVTTVGNESSKSKSTGKKTSTNYENLNKGNFCSCA